MNFSADIRSAWGDKHIVAQHSDHIYEEFVSVGGGVEGSESYMGRQGDTGNFDHDSERHREGSQSNLAMESSTWGRYVGQTN